CIVLRAYGGDADPPGELGSVEAELLLADLGSIESALTKGRKKARSSSDAQREVDILERANKLLDAEQPLRDGEWHADELKFLRGFGALTLKPWIVVANIEEGGTLPDDLPAESIGVSASLEAEVAGMDESDARELLGGFGVTEPGLGRVIRSCYQALDLITFLTTGEDETRAWEVRRGAKAPEAAGVIHTDLERGFIRAEVVHFDDIVAAGSWADAKTKGTLRVEGKDYEVKEGDCLNIRFAV
ncbi:MAG: DUF933 domain-containing protein, partial [Actinomycetota bacterium]